MNLFIRTLSVVCITLISLACSSTKDIDSITIHNYFEKSIVDIIPVVNGFTTVPISINGKEKLAFMVDTGSNASFIFDSPSIEQLGIFNQNTLLTNRVSGGFGDNTVQSGRSDPVNMNLGTLNIEHMSFHTIRWNRFSLFHNHDSVFWDGILGTSLLKNFIVEVDNLSKKVSLYPKNYDLSYLTEGHDVSYVPFELINSKLLTNAEVTLRENDRPIQVRLVIDTGFNGTINLSVPQNTIDEYALDSDKTTEVGIAGNHSSRSFQADNFNIGGIDIRQQHMLLTSEPRNGLTKGDGIIGTAFLPERYIFDFKNKRLLLFNIKSKKAISFERLDKKLGIKFAAIGKDLDRYTIIAASENAKSMGIELGDFIYSIDGITEAKKMRSYFKDLASEKREVKKYQICTFNKSVKKINCMEIDRGNASKT